MKKYTLYQVDAFTTEKFLGNPAGVVPDAEGLTEEQMQKIAREMNNSETAFVLPPTDSSHDFWIRFFTPTSEVPTCGHATIATNYIRALEDKSAEYSARQKTGAGILSIESIGKKEDVKIIMTQGKIEFSPPFDEQELHSILKAIGLDTSDLDERCPVQIVSTGHSKVMICITSRKKLNDLTPDLTALKSLSEKIGCKGYFVFTIDSDSEDILTYARMFAPAIGINEDPVTGNGNGPLGAYIVHHNLVPHNGRRLTFTGIQGESMGRRGIIEVTVDIENNEPEAVKVAGNAVIVFRTEIMV